MRRWLGVTLAPSAMMAACGLDAVGALEATSAVAPDADMPDGAVPSDAPSAEADGGADATVQDAVADTIVDGPCTADVVSDLANCGGCGMACPAGTTSCNAGQCYASLKIALNLDGISQLVVKGNVVRWYHVEYVPPGVTALNGVNWTPTWPSSPPEPCNCFSTNSTTVTAALPAIAQTVTLEQLDGRFPVTLTQPAAGNNYELRVKYDDDMGGFDYYDVVVRYRTR